MDGDFDHSFDYSGAATPEEIGGRSRSSSIAGRAAPVLKVVMLTKHYVSDQKTWAPLVRHVAENLFPAWLLNPRSMQEEEGDASVVEVLSGINAELLADSVTCLLGSNGGGWLLLP